MRNFIEKQLKLLLEQKIILFDIPVPQEIKDVVELFAEHNHVLYLVGGAVRDALLGVSIKDYDLATDATPDKVQKILHDNNYKTVAIGESFGVVNLVTDSDMYEIATFRTDGKYTDSRRPDSVEFANVQDDAYRRDLTINALYYDILNKKIIDFVGGVEDIKNKRIRAVGSADERFAEDNLRRIRAIRFAARTNTQLDDEIKDSLLKDNDISKITKERIRDEFIKGFKSAVSKKYFVEMLIEYGFIEQIFPNLTLNLRVIEESDYIVYIAWLLKDNEPNNLSNTLNGLTYTKEENNAIIFLTRLKDLKPENVVPYKRSQKRTVLTDNQILTYSRLIGVPDKLLTAFVDFELTVSGSDMIALGVKPGPDMGKQIDKTEVDNFKKLLREMVEVPLINNFNDLYSILPAELKNIFDKLKDNPENTVHHPEGTTYKHTEIVVNRLIKTGDINLILAGLFHDIGKLATTEINPKTGLYSAHGHEKESIKMMEKYRDFIESLGGDYDKILYYVENHMRLKNLGDMRKKKRREFTSNKNFDKLSVFGRADKMSGEVPTHGRADG